MAAPDRLCETPPHSAPRHQYKCPFCRRWLSFREAEQCQSARVPAALPNLRRAPLHPGALDRRRRAAEMRASGMTYKAIAAVMGVSIANVRAKYFAHEREVQHLMRRWEMHRRRWPPGRIEDPDDPGQAYKGRWLTDDPTSIA